MKFIEDTLNIETLDSNATQTIMIHAGAGKTSIGHLSFWIPTFELSGVEFVILTREMVVYTTLLERFPTLSIVYAKSPLDVEAVVTKLESLKAVFYTINVGKNIHLLRFNHIKHIYIGSENSDMLSNITKFYRAYDEIYISGNAMVDKFRSENIRLGHLKFIKIGKPYLKPIFEQKRTLTPKFQLSYIPSWEGKSGIDDFSSLYSLSEFLYKIRDFDILLFMKFHPSMGKRDKSLLSFSENIETISNRFSLEIEQYVYPTVLEFEDEMEEKIEELDMTFNSDVIICDLERLSLEYLALDIPLFIYIPQDKSMENFLERQYFSYEYAYTFSTIDELIIKLKKVLDGNDELKENRKEAIEYWIGREETMSNSFIECLKAHNIKDK